MTRSHLSRLLRAVGVALLPAVALLCCAGGANAECGSYVQIIGPDGKVQPAAGHESMPAERPCQGPECTGGPKAPAPIPAVPTSPLTEVKGLVGDADEPLRSSGTSRSASDADGSPISRPTSIFHPPRAS